MYGVLYNVSLVGLVGLVGSVDVVYGKLASGDHFSYILERFLLIFGALRSLFLIFLCPGVVFRRVWGLGGSRGATLAK